MPPKGAPCTRPIERFGDIVAHLIEGGTTDRSTKPRLIAHAFVVGPHINNFEARSIGRNVVDRPVVPSICWGVRIIAEQH